MRPGLLTSVPAGTDGAFGVREQGIVDEARIARYSEVLCSRG